MTPLITIAIPAYKAQYIDVAIRSALEQTYGNIEIIIVDDCSPYDIKSVVDSFANDKIKYYRNENNLGANDPSQNWNKCLELANGEFLCLLCDDDKYAPTYVEQMVALTKKYPEADIFRCGVKILNGNQETVGLFPLAPEHESIEEYIWHLHSGNNRQTISEWMLRTSALRKIGGYVNSPKAWGSDAMTIFTLGRYSEVITSPERLVFFRMSSINITGMEHAFIKEKVFGWNRQCEMAAELISMSGLEYKEVILREVWRDHKHWNKNLIKNGTLPELTYLYKVKKSYRIKKRWFVKPFFYALLRILHLKK